MSNVTIAVKGSIVTFTVDTSKAVGPTGSGDNVMVASLNEKLSGELAGFRLGFNLYRRPKDTTEIAACAQQAKVAAALKAAKAA
jgi:hypothetical protein